MNRRYFLASLGAATIAATSTPAIAGPRVREKPRILSFYHLHTDSRIDITYRVGDNYLRSALRKLNFFFRDFRTGDIMPMDPRLLDTLYDLKVSLGDADARYDVLSAYRSPKTNRMLRQHSRGVAKNSLHLRGKAIDIRFPDLPISRLHSKALTMKRGGVGYYPRSEFVHLDTGPVRNWRS